MIEVRYLVLKQYTEHQLIVAQSELDLQFDDYREIVFSAKV